MSEIAVKDDQRATVQLSTDQLKYIADTEFVPRGLRGNLPAILACVATGRELGIGDMMSLKSIHIIDGSPSYSAELMVMLVRRAGHSISGSTGEGQATVKGKRTDNGDEMTVTWTLAMAERAGLAKKNNWRQYPEAMLWARAVSQLCRMLFADCFAGVTYTTEELGEENTGADAVPEADDDDRLFPPVNKETGEIVEPGSVPIISEAQRKRLRAIQNRCGVTDDDLKDMIEAISGVRSSKLIPVHTYDALVAAVEAAAPEGQFPIPESARG